jgi:hypothetical protein
MLVGGARGRPASREARAEPLSEPDGYRSRMTYAPRSVRFLERDGRLKHYGVAVSGGPPRAELAAATRQAAADAIPEGAFGFTIAHDAATAGLGLVYWWENENEIHQRVFAAPIDDPGRLAPADGTGMACVWELEVIDFERRAWLEDVLKRGDTERYLERALEEIEL